MKSLINGAELEVRQKGEGETVLFVHGSNSDYRTWQTQQNFFAQEFNAITYSRRYHYPNEGIADGVDYSMAEHLTDLAMLMKSLDDEPVHLIGHSYGAFLALLLAMRQPELIRTLVLTEPPVVTLFISIPPKPQEILKLLVTRPRTALAIIRFAITGLNPATTAAENDDMDEAITHFGTAILGNKAFNNLSEERFSQVRANYIKTEITGSGFLPLDDTDVSELQIPTLLVNGTDSPALFHRLTDRLYELLPNVRRVVIPHASHIVHEDNSRDYNAAVLDFIKHQ